MNNKIKTWIKNYSQEPNNHNSGESHT